VIRVPPLRARRSEVVHFARVFLDEAARAMSATTPEIPPATAAWLERQEWPGNLRQLKNSMERAMLLCGDGPLLPSHLSASGNAPDAAPAVIDDERERILAVLARFGGNQTYAARALGIARNTLIARLEKYGIVRPRRTR
jgi:DNA-binding NtrC family response regulator